MRWEWVPPGSQGSPSGPWGLSSAALKPGKRGEEPGALRHLSLRQYRRALAVLIGRILGVTFIHSFVHSHFLYTRTALSTTEERGQVTGALM